MIVVRARRASDIGTLNRILGQTAAARRDALRAIPERPRTGRGLLTGQLLLPDATGDKQLDEAGDGLLRLHTDTMTG